MSTSITKSSLSIFNPHVGVQKPNTSKQIESQESSPSSNNIKNPATGKAASTPEFSSYLQLYDGYKHLTAKDKELLGLPSADMMTNCMAQQIASLRESGALTGEITSTTVELGPERLSVDLFSLMPASDLAYALKVRNHMEKYLSEINNPKLPQAQGSFDSLLKVVDVDNSASGR